VKPLFLCLLATLAAWSQCATIPQIQGNGEQSPCINRNVVVTGVVTFVSRGLNGYFLQDANGDGDAATSDGLFMFGGANSPLPEVGQVVEAGGRVVEFTRTGQPGSLTEIDGRLRTAGTDWFRVISTSPLPRAVKLLSQDAAAMEAREGMRVALTESIVSTPANRFGEYYVTRYEDAQAPVRRFPGDAMPAPLLVASNNNTRTREVKTFDLIPAITGVLHYDFGTFRLEPAEDYSPEDGGFAASPLPALPAGAMRIVSINTQRLVSELAAAPLEDKLRRLTALIDGPLGRPDVVTLQEVNDGALVAQLAARLGGYESVWRSSCDPGRISLGVLFRSSRIAVLAQRQLQVEQVRFPNGTCTLSDGRRFANYLFDRPPLIVELRVSEFSNAGRPLVVVVNHWRSRIGGNTEEREAAAAAVAAELRSIGESSTIVLGDFNDSEDSSPLQLLQREATLYNLNFDLPREQRYSLAFAGSFEALDHVLVPEALRRRVLASGLLHVHADFPENGRTSDHDVPWVDIR
jgi:uncharacterized protein